VEENSNKIFDIDKWLLDYELEEAAKDTYLNFYFKPLTEEEPEHEANQANCQPIFRSFHDATC
jgi:hypothetical protein